MRKTIWTGTCSAIVAMTAIAITAQTPAQPQSTTPAATKVVVTGCLKEAPATAAAQMPAPPPAPTGTTGAAGTTGATSTTGTADQKFLLTNATRASAEASPDAATAATATAQPSAPAVSVTYRLVANPSALSPHVGKKLELTGTLENSSPAAAAPESAAADANAPILRVQSGKIIAASCSE